MLVYGMIGWLAVITLAAVIVFIVIHVKLSRAASILDDEETGSTIASKKSRGKESRSRSRSRPAPLSASKQLPSMSPPGITAAPSFLDYDYAVSVIPVVNNPSSLDAELGQ